MRHRIVGMAVILAGCVIVLTASAATAHNRILSSTPGEGQTVSSTPVSLEIVMKGELAQEGAALTLLDPTAQQVRLGAVSVQGPRLRAPVPTLARAGTYTVTYRASTRDGHVLSGSYAFTFDPDVGFGGWLGGMFGLAVVCGVVAGVVVRRQRMTAATVVARPTA